MGCIIFESTKSFRVKMLTGFIKIYLSPFIFSAMFSAQLMYSEHIVENKNNWSKAKKCRISYTRDFLPLKELIE